MPYSAFPPAVKLKQVVKVFAALSKHNPGRVEPITLPRPISSNRTISGTKMNERIYIYLIVGFLFLFSFVAAHAAPKAELWDVWQTNSPQSALQVDHSLWSRFLAQYVTPGKDGINRVHYGSVSETDRQALARYIKILAGTPVGTLNQNEQKAYWINLYNGLTVQLILDHYPVDSIRDIDISPGFFSDGPWGKKLVQVEGFQLSLDDIEHRILRPIFQDNRVHYAVNCASIGCPNLQEKAFTPENMDILLVQAAHDYINHPRGVRVTERELIVSSIYDWFAGDFVNGNEAVLNHLRSYADEPLRTQLSRFNRISGYEYDWSLNE